MDTQPQCKTPICLLKTAVATVTAGDRHVRANILFDDGAQRSFVTQKLANSLKLEQKIRKTSASHLLEANHPHISC